MKKIFSVVGLLLLGIPFTYAQNSITTQSALDFLTLSTDARSSGMGDVGVGTSPDAYSHYYNPAKYVFGKEKLGASLAYTPWMRSLVKDMNIVGVNGFYKLDSLQSISTSFRYFNMGDMVLKSIENDYMGQESPNQLAVDVAYARKLSAHFSASVAFRYIHSDIYPNGQGYKKGNAVAGDITAFYSNGFRMFGSASQLGMGMSLTNVGTKVSYKDGKEYFLPLMLKLGSSISMELNQQNQLMIAGELGRSLVPTKAEDIDKSSLSGMFSALGSTSLTSIMWSLGAEYGFNHMFFARTGFFHQSDDWGGRQYVTFGAGVAYNVMKFDLSYLISTNKSHSPLNNMLRFSIAFNISH